MKGKESGKGMDLGEGKGPWEGKILLREGKEDCTKGRERKRRLREGKGRLY